MSVSGTVSEIFSIK